MATIVFDSSTQSRNAVTALLSLAGLKNVMSTGNSGRFLHMLKEHVGSLQMIVLSSRPGEEVAVRLSQAISEMPEFFSVPVLFLTDSNVISSQRRDGPAKNLLRVDQFLVRPFGPEKLQRAIDAAAINRAKSRDVVLVFSREANSALLETLFEFDSEFHWREIVFASSPLELASKFKALSWRVGAVLIDPRYKSNELRNALATLRRSSIGAQTPFVLLGSSPDETFLFRDLCELFFSKVSTEPTWSQDDWYRVLKISSLRLLNNEPSRRVLAKARGLFRSRQFALARKLALQALDKDPFRFELLELVGRVEENLRSLAQAVVYYQRAISINPCAPYSYIRLLANLQGPLERKDILEKSESYCPKHPQVQDQLRHSREVSV